MSPTNNHLHYLAYFHEAMKECTPAVADDPEQMTQQLIDKHWVHPTELRPLPEGKKYVLKMQASGFHKCQRCGDYRPLHMFGQFKSKVSSFNPNGYDSYCKSCRNEMAKAHQRGKS